MSDPAVDYRLRELERRVGRNETIIDQVPVMGRDLSNVSKDIAEIKDDQRSLRRALYTMALSVAGSAILFVYGATELFK